MDPLQHNLGQENCSPIGPVVNNNSNNTESDDDDDIISCWEESDVFVDITNKVIRVTDRNRALEDQPQPQ